MSPEDAARAWLEMQRTAVKRGVWDDHTWEVPSLTALITRRAGGLRPRMG